MPLKQKELALYMGPQELGAPDDLKKVIIDFIDKTEKRLDIAIQELDDIDIAKAIIRAKNRKWFTVSGKSRYLSVNLVLEGDYLQAIKPDPEPFEKGGSLRDNRTILNALFRSAINVKTDFNGKIFHQKFMIRDGKELLMGSTNFTKTGTSKNLNHIAVVSNKKVVSAYKKEFKEIMAGKFGKNSEVTPKPVPAISDSVRLKPLFAPNHNPEMEIMKQMAKAKEQIDFAVFTFAESSGIDDQMNLNARAGIKVSGLINGDQKNRKWSASKFLDDNIEVQFTQKGKKGLGKLHHKLMVIDKKVVIIGSFNYTKPANLFNDENVLIIGDIDETSEVGKKNQAKIAEYALKEIERINKEFTY
ncbi:phospholipase D-like domain-containing protein [Labilibacter marinus]|uniref:phospholipase D-like domain-containing protein n=1 Tax=Labilibacter marinus TaxID=1477105 RepID=UPI00083347F1|nr:phospholipase D-like domain-containing protein [Labilibacter marinus]